MLFEETLEAMEIMGFNEEERIGGENSKPLTLSVWHKLLINSVTILSD